MGSGESLFHRTHLSGRRPGLGTHTVGRRGFFAIGIAYSGQRQRGNWGTVTRAGKGFAGAMVVLVPNNPEVDHDLFRRDQSDLDGSFLLRGVVPGSYTLLAIENGWDLDWSQPLVIAAYLKHGRRIPVSSQGGRPMNVAESIEVKSRRVG